MSIHRTIGMKFKVAIYAGAFIAVARFDLARLFTGLTKIVKALGNVHFVLAVA
jgi:hypothetical protein